MGLPDEIIALDVETTMNDRKPIEVAIISNIRGLLFHSYCSPGYCTKNQYARKGLPDKLLQISPPFEERLPEMMFHLNDKHVIAWWMEFDSQFFPDNLSSARQTHCAMQRFDPYLGVWNYRHGNYRRTALEKAMQITGLEYGSPGPHRAISDAFALLGVWGWMERNPINALVSNDTAKARHRSHHLELLG